MDRDLAATNVRLGVLLFIVSLIMFGGAFGAGALYLADSPEEEAVTGLETPTAVASPTPTEVPAGQVVDIAMVVTLRFDKGELTVKAGEPVTVVADNQDTGVIHNFALYTDEEAARKAQEPIAATKLCTAPCTAQVTFDPPAPGEYFFRCDVHPLQMTGKFVVQE